MDAQLERPSHDGHHHHEDTGLHSVVEGEGEREHEQHHHDEGEKKSVLKKVKDKAKKMKDTLKKHVQGDNQDHQLQGPPCMIESTVLRSKNLPREGNTTNLEKPRERHQHQSHESENKNINSAKQEEVDSFDHNLSSVDDPPPPPPPPVSRRRDNINNEFDSSHVRAYLSHKFTPGEEDKALSEVITRALHKQKEAALVILWRQQRQRQQHRGKVTVSKEVAARLGPADGSKREGEDALSAGEESSGNGLTDRLKDALNSWLTKSAGIQTAQDSLTNAFVNNSTAASGSNDNNRPTTHP